MNLIKLIAETKVIEIIIFQMIQKLEILNKKMEQSMNKMDGNIYLLRENQKKEDMLMDIYARMTLKIFKKL